MLLTTNAISSFYISSHDFQDFSKRSNAFHSCRNNANHVDNRFLNFLSVELEKKKNDANFSFDPLGTEWKNSLLVTKEKVACTVRFGVEKKKKKKRD